MSPPSDKRPHKAGCGAAVVQRRGDARSVRAGEGRPSAPADRAQRRSDGDAAGRRRELGAMEAERVHRLAAQLKLVVHVRPRGASRGPALGDHLAGLDAVARRHEQLGVVAVGGRDAAPVIDDHHLAVDGVLAGPPHDAGAGGVNGSARGHREVDSGVLLLGAEQRVRAQSKGRGDPRRLEHRPPQRKRAAHRHRPGSEGQRLGLTRRQHAGERLEVGPAPLRLSAVRPKRATSTPQKSAATASSGAGAAPTRTSSATTACFTSGPRGNRRE